MRQGGLSLPLPHCCLLLLSSCNLFLFRLGALLGLLLLHLGVLVSRLFGSNLLLLLLRDILRWRRFLDHFAASLLTAVRGIDGAFGGLAPGLVSIGLVVVVLSWHTSKLSSLLIAIRLDP